MKLLLWSPKKIKITVLEISIYKEWTNLITAILSSRSMNPSNIVEMLKQVKSKAMIKTVSAGS